jgi:hypothetical protein
MEGLGEVEQGAVLRHPQEVNQPVKFSEPKTRSHLMKAWTKTSGLWRTNGSNWTSTSQSSGGQNHWSWKLHLSKPLRTRFWWITKARPQTSKFRTSPIQLIVSQRSFVRTFDLIYTPACLAISKHYPELQQTLGNIVAVTQEVDQVSFHDHIERSTSHYRLSSLSLYRLNVPREWV